MLGCRDQLCHRRYHSETFHHCRCCCLGDDKYHKHYRVKKFVYWQDDKSRLSFLTEFLGWCIKVGFLLIMGKGHLRTHLTRYAEQKPFFPFWRCGHLFSGTLFPWKQVLTPEHTHIPNIYTWQCPQPMLKLPNH